MTIHPLKLPLHRLAPPPTNVNHRVVVGSGIGSILSRLAKFVTPLFKKSVSVARPAIKAVTPGLKRVAKEVASQSALGAAGTVADMLAGESVGESAKKNFKRGKENVKKVMSDEVAKGTNKFLDKIDGGEVALSKKRRKRKTKKVTIKGRGKGKEIKRKKSKKKNSNLEIFNF